MASASVGDAGEGPSGRSDPVAEPASATCPVCLAVPTPEFTTNCGHHCCGAQAAGPAGVLGGWELTAIVHTHWRAGGTQDHASRRTCGTGRETARMSPGKTRAPCADPSCAESSARSRRWRCVLVPCCGHAGVDYHASTLALDPCCVWVAFCSVGLVALAEPDTCSRGGG